MKYDKRVEYQPTEIHKVTCRPVLIKFFTIVVICAGFALAGCDTGKVDASAETSSEKEKNMESLHANKTDQKNIPPIDAVAATRTETATFAMG